MVRQTKRALLAICLALALTFTSLVSLFGLSTASAEQNNKIKVAVSKIERVSSTNEPIAGQIYKWNRVKLSFTFDATSANPQPGDSFYLKLPAEFNNLEPGSKRDLVFRGVKAGECELSGSKDVICTLGEGIRGKREVHGSGMVILSAVELTTKKTVDIDANGEIIPVPLPGDGIKPSPHGYHEYLSKWASSIVLSRNYLNWDILFNVNKLSAQTQNAEPITRLVWKDTLTSSTDDGSKAYGHYYHTDKARWVLYLRDAKGDTAPQYHRIVDATGRQLSDKHKGFGLDVQFNNADKPTEATITVTGPFQPDTNYYVNYRTRPNTPNGLPNPSEKYSNEAKLVYNNKEIVLKRDIKYTQGFEVNIEFKEGLGGFSLTKNLSGEARDRVAPGTTFTALVDWELPGGKTANDFPDWTPPAAKPAELRVALGQTATFPGDFPVGTRITLTEDPNTADPAANVIWGDPEFTIDGKSQGKTASFVIENKKAVAVTVTNEANKIPAVSVGDFVWLDADRDGIQDDGEKGIKGVELR
ncbi:DUF5979 domain-containing protein, partial [Tessaracoccus sp. OH4464_COT-324]|uniref:DUF7926 domain-containing protein n=1 Tax=Tessaracoccus sp. OH4464_COT-324 TaxID=2491059 RepID=UPI000FBABEF9